MPRSMIVGAAVWVFFLISITLVSYTTLSLHAVTSKIQQDPRYTSTPALDRSELTKLSERLDSNRKFMMQFGLPFEFRSPRERAAFLCLVSAGKLIRNDNERNASLVRLAYDGLVNGGLDSEAKEEVLRVFEFVELTRGKSLSSSQRKLIEEVRRKLEKS
ncbi:MAG: hypothetical protein JNK90_14190 [Planctomycetaceae bacterium]|nr:hypothetical protein [Planctomycetaceae bacterium]MBN8600948.1 hypothetical protein [Planctomycetota bacterium]